MSSTGRGARRRHEFDYYVTPLAPIKDFLRAWQEDDPDAKVALSVDDVLDPCAGGNATPTDWEYKPGYVYHIPPTPMPYPQALREELGVMALTNDVRPDSPAERHGDFLAWADETFVPGVVITNPPFSIAMEVILKSLELVREDGYVVMLLRLNFFGSAKRLGFFQTCAPLLAYVHHERMSFTPDGKADSVEYVHMVWKKGVPGAGTLTRVI